MEPEIIIEATSPFGNVQALVEKTDRTYFFYLWINPKSNDRQMRACWICNRIRAPKNMNDAFPNDGREPCMPEEFVAHDLNGIDIDESDLSIEWFEEGDGAFLLSGEDIIAVIPGFSGYNDFYGYSAYAKGTGPFAWEIDKALPHLKEELDRCRRFWNFFEKDFWGDVQQMHLDVLQKFMGKHEEYYAIDQDKFPPKAMVTGKKDDTYYAFTLGVSMFPMPTVEMAYGDDYMDHRRIELGFFSNDKKVVDNVLSGIAFLGLLPWEGLTFLGHGHTLQYNKIPGYDHLLMLDASVMKDIDHPVYPDFMGEKINLLWLKLITDEEYDFIVDKGVDEYLSRYR